MTAIHPESENSILPARPVPLQLACFWTSLAKSFVRDWRDSRNPMVRANALLAGSLANQFALMAQARIDGGAR